MNKKMKACFTPHSYMHSLIGLGLGFIIASFFPGSWLLWVGFVAVVVGVVWDMMRKE